MRLIMNDQKLTTIQQITEFLAGSEELEFEGISKEERYQWIERELVRFTYIQRGKADKGVIRRYLEKMSGYSRAQVCRLIKQYKKQGRLRKKGGTRHRFARKYTRYLLSMLGNRNK